MQKLTSFLVFAGLLLALAPAGAQEGTTSTPSTNTPPILNVNRNIKPTKEPVAFNPACVITAVEKRDNAIIAATDTFSAAVKTALTTRRDALKTAWGLTDRKERRAALKAAWKAYKDAVVKARKDLNAAKRAAWKQWDKDRRACKGTPNDEAGAASGADSSL